MYIFGAVIMAGTLMWLTFWSLLDWQARGINGRVAFLEPFMRCYLTVSLWIVFYALFWLIDKVLERSFRFEALRPRKTVAIVLATLLFAPYLFLALQIHRGKIANATNPRRALGLPFEDVAFRSSDGVLLRGWFIPHKGSNTTIVLCHGVSANKGAFLGLAPFLHRAGFNVLMFDFRGHGDSGGYTTSLGYYEARDVRAAVDYLVRRGGVRRIGAYGFSMGGAASLLAAPTTAAIDCVVADSAYADMKEMAMREFDTLPFGLNRAVVPVIDLYTKLALGVWLEEIAPRAGIANISPRALLLIHGTADTRVPVEQARSNFAAAHEPKELWLVPNATHVLAHRMLGAVYERRVAHFLRIHLSEPQTKRKSAF